MMCTDTGRKGSFQSTRKIKTLVVRLGWSLADKLICMDARRERFLTKKWSVKRCGLSRGVSLHSDLFWL